MADLFTPDVAAQLPADFMTRFDALPEDDKSHAAAQIIEAANAGQLPQFDLESLLSRMDDDEIIETVHEVAADARADAEARGDDHAVAEIDRIENEFDVQVSADQDGDGEDIFEAFKDDGGDDDNDDDGGTEEVQVMHDSMENALGAAALAEDGEYIEITGDYSD